LDPNHPSVPPQQPAPDWRAASAAAVDPMIGKTIADGRYSILSVLGKGGMSIVYKARQNMVDREVAIKTLKFQMLGDPKIVLRFEREVKLLSKLNHPNIVTVFDCVMVQNQPYFVMDCLSGQSLQELLKAEGRLSPERAQHIFIQCCSAVEHAHRKGVIHRDIKPGNIMISPGSGGRDFVKVVDFGLARLGADAQKLTQTGEIWGSPLYMSPEQASAQDLDARSDIYSLGTVMFETLTGVPPFKGKNFMETMSMQVHTDTPAMRDVAPATRVPPALEEIVRKTLEKEPENRFQTMAEIKESLKTAVPGKAYQTHSPIAAAEDPQAEVPTMLLKKRPTVNGFNYKAKKKGWSAKLIVSPLIAGALIVLVALAFKGMFLPPMQAPQGVTATSAGRGAAPHTPPAPSPVPPAPPAVPAAPAASTVPLRSTGSQQPPMTTTVQHSSTPTRTSLAPPAIPHAEQRPAVAPGGRPAEAVVRAHKEKRHKHKSGTDAWTGLKELRGY